MAIDESSLLLATKILERTPYNSSAEEMIDRILEVVNIDEIITIRDLPGSD